MWLLALAATGSAAQANYYTPGWNLYSPQQDVEIGRLARAQAIRQLPVLRNPDAATYLAELGTRLASQMPGPKFAYTFQLIEQKAINAFALPGGPIFVNLGTICAAANEAQLAGLLAHEASHIALRHSTSMASEQAAVSLPLGMLGGMFGRDAGQLASVGMAMVARGAFLKYSRDMESQADALGAQVMSASGYDPQQLAGFFAGLEAEGGTSLIEFLSDHPNPGNRRAAIAAEIPKLGSHPPYREASQPFDRVHNMLCAGEVPTLVPPQEIRFQGASLTPPEGWSAFGDETSQLTLAPADGFAGSEQDDLVRGVIVGTFPGSARGLTNELRRANPHLREVAHTRGRVRLAGAVGDTVTFSNRNAYSVKETDWLVTYAGKRGELLYLICLAPTSEAARFGATFDLLLASLKPQ
ncbi:MAG: M48 family metalloprotease [Terriglobales bacterium]